MIRSVLSILSACIAVSSFAESQLPSAPHVYVEGSASISAPPDQLKVTIYYEAHDASVEVAKAQVDERSRAFITACGELQIQDQDISSAMLQVGPGYEYVDGDSRPSGTQVSRSINVTLRDLGKYSDFIAAVMASHVSAISNAEMESSQAKEPIARAQNDALADARARAERLASAANAKLGRVYSISEFGVRNEEAAAMYPSRSVVAAQPYRFGTVTSASSGVSPEPFTPGLVSATAHVYVVHLLEK